MTKEEALNHLREILFYEYLGNKETQAIIFAIKSLEEDIKNNDRLKKN